MIYHDIAARHARQCIADICDEIRVLEKQDGTEHDIAVLRATKDKIKKQLLEYMCWVYQIG